MNEIILCDIEEARYCSAWANGQLQYLTRAEEADTGRIVVGRVENIVHNLHAAFVRIGPEQTGYLPLTEVPYGALCNRPRQRGDTLRQGDMLAVETVSAARGNKQPKLTGFLTLSGDYAVVTFGKTGIGCSNKLDQTVRQALQSSLRQRLKEDAYRLPQDFFDRFGVIIRTEAASAENPAEALAQEVALLAKRLSGIMESGRSRTVGSVLYQRGDNDQLLARITDLTHFLQALDADTPIAIRTEDKALYESLRETDLLKAHTQMDGAPLPAEASVSGKPDAPAAAPGRLQLTLIYHDREADGRTLSARCGLEKELKALRNKRVWLKSGAYLVIEQTEAMLVVDVNSGKHIAGKKNAAAAINLEAAEETFRQLRLRNARGIIVMDLINMPRTEDVHMVKEKIRELCALDPVYTEFIDITPLGIAEITRTVKQ